MIDIDDIYYAIRHIAIARFEQLVYVLGGSVQSAAYALTAFSEAFRHVNQKAFFYDPTVAQQITQTTERVREQMTQRVHDLFVSDQADLNRKLAGIAHGETIRVTYEHMGVKKFKQKAQWKNEQRRFRK